ncbi:HlyD family efflux transporter periplasmic adaptor subunit [Candidatus Parcubacteria bacterium]|nr:MAG: HlyD family efflux transporter periplasmic adaptor subunit [Candidatus Parcubacteria bacterium]
MIKRLLASFYPRSSTAFMFGVSLVLCIPFLVWLLFGQTHPRQIKHFELAGKHSFDLHVIARGVVAPARIVPVQSSIMSNQAKLIWLEKDGAKVNAGDIIARFDTKPFEDQLRSAKADLLEAETRLAATEKTINLKKEENAGKLSSTIQKVETASIKADNMLGGARLKRGKIWESIKSTKRELKRALEDLNDFNALFAKGYVSRHERDQAKNHYMNVRDHLEYLRAKLKNFDAYEWPRIKREAELIKSAAKEEAERVRRTTALELERLEVRHRKELREVAAKKAIVKTAKKNLAHCTVKSPAYGILLHMSIPRPSGSRKIQIGDAIWINQTFMEVAETDELIVRSLIREADVAHLRKGMKADIRLDALPDRIIPGELRYIATLPQSNEQRNGVHLYPAKIRILKTLPEIRVGMSATVSIIYRHVKNVLAIPVAAISYHDATPIVSVWIDGYRTENRPVRLGAVGNKWAEIVEGLHEGDRVLKVH